MRAALGRAGSPRSEGAHDPARAGRSHRRRRRSRAGHSSLSRRRAFARAAAFAFGLSLWVGCASPPPADGPPRLTRSESIPWDDLRAASAGDGSALAAKLPEGVGRLDRVLRRRAVYRLPGFAFGHLVLGPGALYPYHAHATPEAYHVVSGEAEWSVDGETRRVGPGTTLYHAPYADRRWVTVSEEPLRVVWARWAPDGDRAGFRIDALRKRGGAMTGDFFDRESKSRTILPIDLARPVVDPPPGSILDGMRRARLAARTQAPRRPPVRAFVDSVGVPWNVEIPGVRWRLVFATPDLEWGHLIVTGPAERTLPAGAVPALIHVLSGRATFRVGADRNLAVRAGTSVAVAPGEVLEVDFGAAAAGEATPEPLRAFWVRRAPDPDLSDWARDDFLIEPVPEPPPGAALPRDVRFFPDRADPR